ncbi:DinB family protein [Fictibacillus nanhaiensis]|uniref:DinB family protein n=1 Tax=Fictibacillus nanhaiensis TaxID=742169 RepID=UPI001C94DF4A|nr:DinB family protein [Fictibacillus nanhaiensis]MBY6037395.1 DinB family protein [Fictibacillus nanhaiensis]
MQTSSQSPFVIDQIEGYSKDFSSLICMMNYTRRTTIQAVENLTVEALDFRINGTGNSIGMLLAHSVAVEKIYQFLTMGGKDLPDEEIDRYADTLQPALDLGEAATIISGNTADFYLEDMEKTREKTLELFRTLPDSWLYETTPWWDNELSNNYFKWFHVFEDELSHRGQMRIIQKHYELSKK